VKNFLKQLFGGFGEDEGTLTPVDGEDAVRKCITVAGQVQGVGFRYFVRLEAHKLGVTGWVMNLNDGTVTMEVQCTPPVLKEFINRIQKGNGYSKIVQMKSYDLEVIKGENKFGIKY